MTYLGPSLVVRGEITGAEDIRIDGTIQGRVVVREGSLSIGTQGRVDADVRGARVAIEGTVRGTISATERVELAATAHVTGDISANVVVIKDGATLSGHVDMDRRTIAARVEQYRTDNPE